MQSRDEDHGERRESAGTPASITGVLEMPSHGTRPAKSGEENSGSAARGWVTRFHPPSRDRQHGKRQTTSLLETTASLYGQNAPSTLPDRASSRAEKLLRLSDVQRTASLAAKEHEPRWRLMLIEVRTSHHLFEVTRAGLPFFVLFIAHRLTFNKLFHPARLRDAIRSC